MDEYKVERLNDNNLKDLILLFKNAFNKTITIEYLNKKYNTDDYGLKYVGFIAYANDNTPAAYYGVFPVKVRYKNKEYLCAQSGDTMTHSEHRGKQLFTKLATETYNFAAKNGVQFVFGFPNNNSYPGFVKYLNWKCDSKMSKFEFKVLTLPLNAIAKKFKFISPVYNLYLKLILSFYKTKSTLFENSALENDTITIPHDDIFYAYKKYSRNYIVELANTDCWLKFDSALLVGDIKKTGSGNLKKIIKSLKRLAFLTGSTKIIFEFSPGTFWDNEFAKLMTPAEGIKYGYVNFISDLPLEKMGFCMGDFDTF
jgi:hypothetical protein